MAQTLFWLQTFCTIYMTGVIWFVQIVHYPLLAAVGPHNFTAYENSNTALTTWVVLPPMCLELLCAALMLRLRPSGISVGLALLGLSLVVLIWASTFFLQVPCHARLEEGFDALIHQRLVSSNWIRTLAWSLRSLLLLWILQRI